MFNPSKKQMSFLYCAAAVLTLLFILSLTVFSDKGKGRRQIQQIQLLHEADISNIDIITIQSGTDSLILTRTNDMWLISNPLDINDRIPADTERLQKFFVILVSKHNMTKAGKSNEADNNSYKLNTQEGTQITLYKNGTAYQCLTFGDLNFSQTERYFTTQELKSVLLAGQEFDGFLNPSIQVWADPYIISSQLRENVFSMGQVQSAVIYDELTKKSTRLESSNPEQKELLLKLLDLRHGGFVEKTNLPLTKSNTINLEMGDKSKITLELFEHPQAENEYIIQTKFESERLQKSFSYTTQISAWTYSKISEMML